MQELVLQQKGPAGSSGSSPSSSSQLPRVVLATWGVPRAPPTQLPAHSALPSGSAPSGFLDILKYFDNLPQLCYKFWGGVKREEVRGQDPTCLPRYSTEEMERTWVTTPPPPLPREKRFRQDVSFHLAPAHALPSCDAEALSWDPHPRF